MEIIGHREAEMRLCIRYAGRSDGEHIQCKCKIFLCVEQTGCQIFSDIPDLPGFDRIIVVVKDKPDIFAVKGRHSGYDLTVRIGESSDGNHGMIGGRRLGKIGGEDRDDRIQPLMRIVLYKTVVVNVLSDIGKRSLRVFGQNTGSVFGYGRFCG